MIRVGVAGRHENESPSSRRIPGEGQSRAVLERKGEKEQRGNAAPIRELVNVPKAPGKKRRVDGTLAFPEAGRRNQKKGTETTLEFSRSKGTFSREGGKKARPLSERRVPGGERLALEERGGRLKTGGQKSTTRKGSSGEKKESSSIYIEIQPMVAGVSQEKREAAGQ